MDLRDLRYFETIATLEHVGRASRKLHRTQPALTSCIRRLEHDCGVPLFERAGRGIRLTPAGHVLLRWAQRMRFDMDGARREIGDIGCGLSGHVTIGIVPTAAMFLLPEAARELIDEAPGVTLNIVVGLIDSLRPKLRAGELDLMIGTESAPDPGFVSTLLAEDSIVVAARADHPIFRRTATLRALGEHAWVLTPPGAPTRDWLDHTFDHHRLPRPRVQIEVSSLLALPSLIAETRLLSFISRDHLARRQAGAALREVQLKETTMRRRLVVVHRENSYMPPVARRLIGLLGSRRPRKPLRQGAA
jgi:DNA-binding transcriptional LysR family regulator